MSMNLNKMDETREDGLLHSGIHNIEKALTDEIECILKRNQNEKFLRKLLTRALILEELGK